MTQAEITAYLDEGLQEEGSIEKAFDYLIENEVRDLFKMNRWDEPKFTSLIIEYRGKKYQVNISEDGCCEATNEHRIMYWKHTVTELDF